MAVLCRGAFLPAGPTLEPVSKLVHAVFPIRSRSCFHRWMARGPPGHLSSLVDTANRM